MKRLIFFLLLFIPAISFSQTQTSYKVTSIANMKTYSGVSSRIHVTATNEDFVNSPASTPDEVTIYDGAGSRVWKKVIDNSRQATLVSGTNIKTVNGTTLLGSGNLVVGGTNLYTDDGALDGARVVDLATFPLSVQENAANFLHIDPTAGSENVLFRANNQTGGTNNAFFEGSTSNASALSVFRADFNGDRIAYVQATSNFSTAQIELNTFINLDDGNTSKLQLNVGAVSSFELAADFNDGVKEAIIQGLADATTSTLTYTADLHTFNAGGETNLSVELGSSFLRAFNPTAGDNFSIIDLVSGTTDVQIDINANFNDGVKSARIQAFADATTSTITHTADVHAFNAGPQQTLLLDATTGSEVSKLVAHNNTGSGNISGITAFTTNTDATVILAADFNSGAKASSIIGLANTTTSTLTYTADTHIFTLTGIPTFADDAAATGGGLTSGTLYKTTTSGSTFLKIVP